MATYLYDHAEATAKDRVRGLCGDVDQRDQAPAERVSDEFIEGLLAGNGGDVLAAAIECARRRRDALAGQKGEHDRAPGLETQRRFDRLSAVYQSLVDRQAGRDSGRMPAMDFGTATDPSDGVAMPRLGSLDAPQAVTL